jgi:hypothetical protein
LIAFTIFLQAFGLFTFTSLFDSLRLNPQAKPLSFWQILSFFINEPMDVPRKCVNDSLLMLLFISSMVSTGMAVAAFRAEELLLKALAVELEASRSFAVTTHLFISHCHFLSLLLIY